MTTRAPDHHAPSPRVDAVENEHPAPRSSPGRGAPPMAPLLAVCGVCGGAGVSTLSYLVARYAVTRGFGHVLVCDTGGPAAGLAAIARVESTWSLSELSDRLTRDLPLTSAPFARDESTRGPGGELRIIASRPRLSGPDDLSALQAILSMARSDGVHALNVVDCGTLQRPADRIALQAASHVAWVLPATPNGVRRGQRLLAAIEPRPGRRELLVARRERRIVPPRLHAAKALARQRHAPLILLPELPDVVEHAARALELAQVGLQAILGVVER